MPPQDVSMTGSARATRVATAGLLPLLGSVVAMLLVGDARHWFIIPVTLCGALVMIDAIDWVRGARDLFDPVGIIGLFGIYFFYIAPLLHVAWDQWMRYVVPPPDWREWLGYMGIVNLAGLLIYRTVIAYFDRTRSSVGTFRAVEGDWFWPAAGCALLVSAAAQMAVFAGFGGIGGYIDAVQTNPEAFQGMGMVFLVSESFPIIALISTVVWLSRRGLPVSWGTIGALIVAFICVRLLFAGLRGSRSATIWSLFWAAGVVHVFLRPIPRKVIPFGLLGVTAFMYVYGFYKSGGIRGVESFLAGGETRQQFAEKSGRTLEVALLWDFGRADVQAYLLYRMVEFPNSYDLALGRTYLGTAFLMVPRQLMPERPPLKNRFGTEAMYGRGSFVPGKWVASQVYGVAGETMLNFGPWVAPLGFGVLGLVVGYVSRTARALRRGDARLLLYPFAANLAFNMLVGDSDNTLVILFQYGLIPIAVVLMGSRSRPANVATTGGLERAVAPVAAGPVGITVAAGLPARRRWGQRTRPGRTTAD